MQSSRLINFWLITKTTNYLQQLKQNVVNKMCLLQNRHSFLKNILFFQYVLCGSTDQGGLLVPDALVDERLYLDAIRLHLQGREQIHVLTHSQRDPHHGDITTHLILCNLRTRFIV